jgi:AcrR family transcriptional regulator
MTGAVRTRKTVAASAPAPPDSPDVFEAGPGDRRRIIVDAAFDLVEAAGPDGLTIRAVLQRTGLARRAFYEEFAGKDDLLLAVFQQTIRRAADHFARQISALRDPMDRLRFILTGLTQGRRSLDEADSQPLSRLGAVISREHLRLAEARPGDLQAALGPLIDLLCRQLGEGMQAGLVRNGDPRRLATLIYNLVSTTVHAEFLAPDGAQHDRIRRVRLAEEIWDFCRRAIAAEAEPLARR